jgi:hypothetical protein
MKWMIDGGPDEKGGKFASFNKRNQKTRIDVRHWSSVVPLIIRCWYVAAYGTSQHPTLPVSRLALPLTSMPLVALTFEVGDLIRAGQTDQ